MRYILKQIDDYTNSETTIDFYADTIDQIFMQFQLFLKGCGFTVDGNIGVFEDDLENHSEYYFDFDRNR